MFSRLEVCVEKHTNTHTQTDVAETFFATLRRWVISDVSCTLHVMLPCVTQLTLDVGPSNIDRLRQECRKTLNLDAGDDLDNHYDLENHFCFFSTGMTYNCGKTGENVTV